MEKPSPGGLPQPHREFLDRAIEKLTQEPWLAGIAAAGSLASGEMDPFSDLDLILAVEENEHSAVMKNGVAIASSLGPLLSAFTGQHVGQPRLLLCLYADPLLHVDIIFDSVSDVALRTGDLVVLWERDDRLSALQKGRTVASTELDMQWIEDRFWVWVHKACGKIGRGELFEAIEYLAFFRSRVLGPLGLSAAGFPPTGVRRIELVAPSLANDLQATLASHDAKECLAALRVCVERYRQLRAAEGAVLQYLHGAESAVCGYLSEMEQRLHQA